MNIAQKAFQTYRKYLANKLAVAFSFTIFVLASLAIALFGSFMFLLLIPIVILPVYVCLQLSNSSFSIGMPLTQRNFFSFYKVAFSPTLNGAYQVLSSFLKAALVYFGLSVLTIFIMSEIYVNSDPLFATEINRITGLLASGGFQEALDAYDNNPTIVFISSISTLVGGGIGLLAFMHLIGRNSIIPHLAFSMSSLPGRVAYTIHRQGLNVFKREYNTDYYQATWFGAPLVLIGFTAGVMATYFFTSNIYLILLAGFAGAFIVLTPLLPYFLDVFEEIFKKYKDRYLQISIDQAKKVYEEIKVAHEISEDQERELDHLIGELNKQVKDKQDNDDKDNEKNDK